MSFSTSSTRLDSTPVVVIPHEDESSGADNGDSENMRGAAAWNERMPASPADDLSGGAELRFCAYLDIWHRCSARIQTLMRQAHTKVVESVMRKVEETYKPIKFSLPYPQIPIMLLVGDSNSADLVFDSVVRQFQESEVLEDAVRDSDTPSTAEQLPIARLSSKDFVNLPSALRALISGFVAAQATVTKKRPNGTTLANTDIEVLGAWYNSLELDYLPEDKRRLVVYIPNVESCNSSVLQDFFHICSSRIPRLPLVFILTTSTSSQIMRSLVTLEVLSSMEIHDFQLEGGRRLFDELILGLFLLPKFDPGFQLTSSLIEHLYDSFAYQEHSIDSFCTAFQMILAKHFSSPTSVFLVPDLAPFVLERMKLPESALFREKIHGMVRHAINQYPLAEATVQILKRMKTSRDSHGPMNSLQDDWVLEYISLARDAFQCRMNRWKFSIRVLRILLRAAGVRLAKIPAPDVIRAVMQGTVFTNEVSHIQHRMKRATLDWLEKIKSRLTSVCRKVDHPAHLGELHTIAQNWDRWFNETVAIMSANQSAKQVPDTPFQFSNLLVVPPEVSTLSLKMATSIEHYFRNQFHPLTDVPLHQLWHVESDLSPMEYLNPSIQQSLVRTLAPTNASNDLFEVTPAVISLANLAYRDQPDTSVIFRRYLESGKMVNIYDWFESYVQAMEGEPRPKEGKDDVHTNDGLGDSAMHEATHRSVAGLDESASRKEGTDNVTPTDALSQGSPQWKRELQARFLHSLHELDLLGLVKATGRKRDHLARTLFAPPR
ncbi:origin recognition complex subunit 3 N-terminus-domain-containing protein [Cantharellus anzutake]|uniref:origin recognition complex subunit 3 N-terminus-domain-containing protein n=1 Tax=Cantharellus anzutake TaxID=1750568 RepID=UPI0019036373|nr:origin recognition complex subunit 3 N-terminus-domain-containing protein [Cantharellus anzutake]KAF8309961.1 origin recognition complex subunit 3 N-terminus-domain-containing protein [Cantharellus anzutake]